MMREDGGVFYDELTALGYMNYIAYRLDAWRDGGEQALECL